MEDLSQQDYHKLVSKLRPKKKKHNSAPIYTLSWKEKGNKVSRKILWEIPSCVLLPLMELSTLDLELMHLPKNLNLIQHPLLVPSASSSSSSLISFDLLTTKVPIFTASGPKPIFPQNPKLNTHYQKTSNFPQKNLN